MADRGNYYDKNFSVWIKCPNGKGQEVWKIRCENCLARHDHSETKYPKQVECSGLLLDCLLQMMNLSSSVVEKIIPSIKFKIVQDCTRPKLISIAGSKKYFYLLY